MNRIYRRDLKDPIDRFHGIDRLVIEIDSTHGAP
jgi:hypothetical protein